MKVQFKAFLEQLFNAPTELSGGKGFVQTVIANLPGYKDPLGRFTGKDNYYMIDIYDKSAGSNKFIPSALINSIIEFECQIVGSRWNNKEGGFGYTNRLQLISWKLVGQKPAVTAAPVVQAELSLNHTTAAANVEMPMAEKPVEGTDDLPF
jgi:hypothetical protein